MMRQAEYFDKASDHNLFMKTDSDLADGMPYAMELEDSYSGHRVCIKYREEDIITTVKISNVERVLGKFGVKSWRALRRLFQLQYPTVNSLQTLCGDLFKHKIEFDAEFYKQSENDGTSGDYD